MLYQSDTKCNAAGIQTMFSTWNESRMEETSFWANAADMGPDWYTSMSEFLHPPNSTLDRVANNDTEENEESKDAAKIKSGSNESSLSKTLATSTAENGMSSLKRGSSQPSLPIPTKGSSQLPSTIWNHVPLFAHVRWANFSSSDLIGLSTFRSVTVQVEPDAPLKCEEQAYDLQTKLSSIGATTTTLMYGNLYFAEPNCDYFAKVEESPWLWLNDSSGNPVRPAGHYAFDLRNSQAPNWWVSNVLLTSNATGGGFGDSGCGDKPSWFNSTAQDAFAAAQFLTHALATSELNSQRESLYIANCPIVPQIGDKPIAGVNGEMIESWCSDFSPGGKAPANYCRDELVEAVVQASSMNRTWLQARYYLNSANDFNPQFGLAAFLIAANEGSFFGASHDWDYNGDWEKLLSWPWVNYSLGPPLSLFPNMTDKDGCGWIRQYENATVTVNLCSKHLFARIEWLDEDVNEKIATDADIDAVVDIDHHLVTPFRNIQVNEGVCKGDGGGGGGSDGALVIAPWSRDGFACLAWKEERRGERRGLVSEK